MALLPLRIDRTSKPPIGTPLRSDGHWSTQGLVGCWLFNEGGGSRYINLVTGISASPTIGTTAPEWKGGDLDINGTAATSTRVLIPAMLNNISGSIVLGFIWDGSTTGEQTLFGTDTVNSARRYITKTSGTGNIATTCNSGSYIGSSAMTAGKQESCALTWKSTTNVSFHFNGKPVVTDGVVGASTGNPASLRFGSSVYNDGGWSGIIRHAFLYNRALSADEIKSLSENPYQICEPEILWINVGSVESFTGDLAAVQASQAQSLAVELLFAGSTAQIQNANSEAIAAALGFNGSISQTQAQQVQTIYQALAGISGVVSQTQAAQIASLVASLAFSGASAQTQSKQVEALAAVLLFTGATTQSQSAQAEALAALLSFGGNVTQTQQIQIEALAAILAFSGNAAQTQAQQQQAISDFVIRLMAILSVTARDPLALDITVSNPLALSVTARDPLSLNIVVK